MANYLYPERQRLLALGLMRGVSQRGLVDILEVDRKTVARHARWLGRTARHLLNGQTDLRLQNFWFDEFYNHILAKRDQANDVVRRSVLIGQFAHFIAIESASGLIVNLMAAPSNGEEATRAFLADFDKRLARLPDGSHRAIPEVITNGHGSYWLIIKEEYPVWNYAQFIKKHQQDEGW